MLLISRTKEIGDGVQRIEQGVEELRMGSQQQRKAARRDEFLNWLSAPDTHGEHCRVREGIDPDSGSWIFDMSQVSKWLANEEADIVWIHGSRKLAFQLTNERCSHFLLLILFLYSWSWKVCYSVSNVSL